jgi:hypothetical protein
LFLPGNGDEPVFGVIGAQQHSQPGFLAGRSGVKGKAIHQPGGVASGEVRRR